MKLQLLISFSLILLTLQTSASNPNGNLLSNKTRRGFIENKGQITDQNNRPNKEVLYLYHGRGLNVQLKQNGFSYEVIKTSASNTSPEHLRNASKHPGDPSNMPDAVDSIYIHRIDLVFEGANALAKITPFEPANDHLNFYKGDANVTSKVQHYQKIIYSNIYPNIDVEFILNSGTPNKLSTGNFKYNFIIRPGGKISDIKLKLNGAINTSLNAAGHIIIQTAYGNIDESIPYSYQINKQNKEQEINAKFNVEAQHLTSNTFGIEVDHYDANQTLVIDPTPWTTYFGGDLDDFAWAMVLDTAGNAIVTGTTYSPNAIATSGAYQTTLSGTTDACIVKFSAAGAIMWATYYGGPINEYALEITVDARNNIYITGNTNSTSGIATSGAYQTALSGINDAFIAKFNASGILQWGTYLGGSGGEVGQGIVTDSSRNVYVGGYTSSTAGIATTGANQTIYGGGNNDAYLMKFNESGARQWGTYHGGSGQEYMYSLAVDKGSNPILGGYTASASGIVTSGAYQTTLVGTADVFVAKFNTSGLILWGTYYGGDSEEYVYDIITDKDDNILVTGYTKSPNGIATSGAYQTAIKGLSDAYVVKFSPSGALQWSTYYGGEVFDYGYSISVDPIGNIWMGGTSNSTTSVATSGAYQTTLSGNYDGMIVKFNPLGGVIWGTYYGGTLLDGVYGINADKTGNIYFAGRTLSTSNIATAGAYQTVIGGKNDIFIGYLPNPSSTTTGIANNRIASDQGLCTGSLPQALTGSTPTGGDGTYVYSWLSSTTNATSGFLVTSGISNTINYTPPFLSSNTWYKRVVNSAGFYDTSNAVAITFSSVQLKAGFTVNKLIQCLKDNQFIFTDTTTTSSGTITRLWTFGNGDTSTSANPVESYNFNAANSYWVKLVVSINGACADSTMQRTILLNNPITGPITGNTLVTRLSTNTYSVPARIGSSYQWFFSNGTGISTTNSIAIKWNVKGTIDLKVLESSGGGCKGDTVFQTITINPTAGIDDLDITTEWSCFPNPTKGLIYLSSKQLDQAKIEVYDLMGRSIYQTKNTNNLDAMQIDLSGFDDGIYSLVITTENGNNIKQKIQLLK